MKFNKLFAVALIFAAATATAGLSVIVAYDRSEFAKLVDVERVKIEKTAEGLTLGIDPHTTLGAQLFRDFADLCVIGPEPYIDSLGVRRDFKCADYGRVALTVSGQGISLFPHPDWSDGQDVLKANNVRRALVLFEEVGGQSRHFLLLLPSLD